MKERYPIVAQLLVDVLRVVQCDRVDCVDGCPTYEELEHNNEQHLDNALLSCFGHIVIGTRSEYHFVIVHQLCVHLGVTRATVC